MWPVCLLMLFHLMKRILTVSGEQRNTKVFFREGQNLEEKKQDLTKAKIRV